jgi:hypothetical protein
METKKHTGYDQINPVDCYFFGFFVANLLKKLRFPSQNPEIHNFSSENSQFCKKSQ